MIQSISCAPQEAARKASSAALAASVNSFSPSAAWARDSIPARLRSFPAGMPKARSTSSEGSKREPGTADEPVSTACAGEEEIFWCKPASFVRDISEAEFCNAASTSPRLAERSLRPEPRSETPLAVSTARKKLTQAMESRMPASRRSTLSAGMDAAEPASRRKQASTSERRESVFEAGGNRESFIKIPRATLFAEAEIACPASASKGRYKDE